MRHGGIDPDSLIGRRIAECGFDAYERDDGLQRRTREVYRELAAVDVLASVSRVMGRVADPAHAAAASRPLAAAASVTAATSKHSV